MGGREWREEGGKKNYGCKKEGEREGGNKRMERVRGKIRMEGEREEIIGKMRKRGRNKNRGRREV